MPDTLNNYVSQSWISGSTDYLAKDKKKQLLIKVGLIAALIGAFHIVFDFYRGAFIASAVDAIITLFILTSYILAYRGFFNFARHLGLLSLNIGLATYAFVLPKEVGVYLFYFPLLAIASSLYNDYDAAERRQRNFYLLLSLSLLALLFITDFKLLGNLRVDEEDTKISFVVNLFSSAIVTLLCIVHITSLNEKSEQKLKQLAREIKIKNTDLEKTNAELDRFFYSTSHDLRAPLLSIKGLVNIAKSETAEPVMASYLNMMQDRVSSLDKFIQDIIHYSRNARTDLREEVVNLHQLVDEVLKNFEFLEETSRIAFMKYILIEEEIIIDKSRLSVVLNNLISNAIKYHNLKIEKPFIKISVLKDDDIVLFKVSDNGKGIAKESQTRIFDMFYRGTEQSKGSGLGLYIVKEVVEKLNGSVIVESIPEQGSTFTVSVPFVKAETQKQNEQIAVEAAG